ncbi:MAG: NAD(P)H-dependent oxidoreductase [Chlorobia bacterium]|nr:NAD(P)H-dependent oxidoreductase [Fimbriimonadaceae bacterium]
MFQMAKLKAILFNCTLKPKSEPSSTQAMLQKVIAVLRENDVVCTVIHACDENILFGVESDMGKGDAWPAIRKKILASDILVIGTPIWYGQRSSVCQMVLERIDAMLYETNAKGQLPLYNKVAGVCVTGNEDGAQHVGSTILYNLMQTGATIPANSEVYWVGLAGGRDDFKDVALDDGYVAGLVETMGNNLVIMACLLKAHPYPVKGNKA